MLYLFSGALSDTREFKICDVPLIYDPKIFIVQGLSPAAIEKRILDTNVGKQLSLAPTDV